MQVDIFKGGGGPKFRGIFIKRGGKINCPIPGTFLSTIELESTRLIFLSKWMYIVNNRIYLHVLYIYILTK